MKKPLGKTTNEIGTELQRLYEVSEWILEQMQTASKNVRMNLIENLREVISDVAENSNEMGRLTVIEDLESKHITLTYNN